MKKLLLATVAASGIALTCGAARADTQFIANGAFAIASANTTLGGSSTYGGQVDYNTTVTGWNAVATPLLANPPSQPLTGNAGTMSGYTFVFTPGAADTGGVTGANGPMGLYPTIGAPSGGGNYIGADAQYPNPGGGDYNTGIQTKVLSGLNAVNQATLTFNWAAAQQDLFTGDTTQQWQVSFGGVVIDTTSQITLPSGTFSGWISSGSINFIPTASEIANGVLQFIAIGAPEIPPITLLADVSLTQAAYTPPSPPSLAPPPPPSCTSDCTITPSNAGPTDAPEPGSLIIMATGLAGIGAIVRRRRRFAVTATA